MIRNNMHPHEYAYNQINIATPILNKNIFNTISCLAGLLTPILWRPLTLITCTMFLFYPPPPFLHLLFFIFFLSGWSRGCATYNVFSYLMTPSM